MAQVVSKFFAVSMLMWMLPLVVLYGVQSSWIPGLKQLSSESRTLLSGLIAVISVNMVIAYYIYMAMKEPSDKHKPDPAFVASARASLSQSKTEGSAELHGKNE